MKKQHFLIYMSLVTCFLLVSTTSTAQLKDRISINGYSSFEFEYQLSDEGRGDPNGSFDADLFDLVFNIEATSRLRFVTDITWEHGAALEDGRGNVAIEYAFPEYTVKEWLKFRAGKMFVPFGIYNEIHTAKPAFLAVKEPLSTNKPHKFGAEERFYPRWATGISILGNFSIGNASGDYHLQMSNGEQENTNPFEEDDNTQKAFAGRVRVNPIPDLKIGASFYNDFLTEFDINDNPTFDRTTLTSYGAQLEYQNQKFGCEFEFVKGNFKPSAGDSQKKYGIEAMFFYTIKNAFTPYLRYEFLEPDIDIDNDNANMISFGLNSMIDDRFFLKLQYNYITSGNLNDRYSGVTSSEFQAALVLGF
ncbi:MAG: hypothetical protein ABFS35_10330 [Bacteroidota bacterium]